MSWFSSRKEQSRVQTVVDPDVHRSLAFVALLEEIRKRKTTVLDLGSTVGSNVEFLSQFGCKLFIEDLYSALTSRSAGGEDDQVGPAFFAELLSLPDDTRFDVILAWDLFNYLQRKELAALAEQLRRYSRPGTLILALTSYHKTMPAQPYRFKIQDEQHLIYERRTPSDRPSPRYTSSEIGGLLKGFSVARSFLLQHGVQEHLLIRE